MAKPSDLRGGTIIRHDGELCSVVEIIHRTPGNLRAFYQARLRLIKTGRLVEYRYRADEDVDIVRVETRDLQFLYRDGNALFCMDNDTYDQIPVDVVLFGDAAEFLKEGIMVKVAFEGDTPITAEAPAHVELEITYTEPGVKGDTVNNVMKPAKLETGAEIKVPLFCDIGQRIKVDTRTGTYVERVK